MVASLVVRFLNFLFFEVDSPITSIAELIFQNGVDFLSALPCQSDGKTQYAEYLTKFYYFCKNRQMAEIKAFKERTSSTYKTYTENIFKGRYRVVPKKKVDVIHEIDTAYLPMLFDTAKDVAPDIYLGLFFQFARGLRASEVVSVEYSSIRIIKESGSMALALKLEDKDLRPDLSSAFISKVKRNRTQMVLPIFGNKLEKAYETHIELYRKENMSAVFIDKNGNPMTVNTYWKRFNHVKREFIKRLHITNDGRWVMEDIHNGNILKRMDHSPVEQNTRHCLAVERLLAKEFGEDCNIPVIPVIFIANNKVSINNESRSSVIRVSEFYTFINSIQNTAVVPKEMQEKIGDLLNSHNIGAQAFTVKSRRKMMYSLEEMEKVFADYVLYNNEIAEEYQRAVIRNVPVKEKRKTNPQRPSVRTAVLCLMPYLPILLFGWTPEFRTVLLISYTLMLFNIPIGLLAVVVLYFVLV